MENSVHRWRHTGLISGIILLMVACASNHPGRERGVESLSVKVTGYSIAGLQYVKEAYITRTSSGYILRYYCRTKWVSGKLCECAEVEKEVKESTVTRLLAELKTLDDEGERAKCCDHPWTEIELIYPDESRRKLTVAFDPVKIEEIFNICSGR